MTECNEVSFDHFPFPDHLPFRDPDTSPAYPYIPTKDEFYQYFQKMKKKKFFSSDKIRAPIAHYTVCFSIGFTSIEEVFPYAQFVMNKLGYEGTIKGSDIVWTLYTLGNLKCRF